MALSVDKSRTPHRVTVDWQEGLAPYRAGSGTST